MNSRRWQDQFQEAARTSELSFASSGSSSALFYALEQKLVSEAEYFAWAQNTFELPVLRMSFFSDHQADATVWQKWKNQYSWQADCLPLSEWDGVLYVACLEPREFPESMKAVCLLTAPAGLKQMWMNYESQSAFELQEISVAPEEAAAPNSDLEMFDMPAGMTAPETTKTPAPSLLVSLEPLDKSTPAPVAVSTPPVTSAPADLDLNMLELDPVAIETPKAPAPAATVLVEKPAAAPAVAKTAAPPPPQRATPQLITNSIYFLDTVLKKENSPLNSSQIFAQMQTHFEKSLILAVDTLEKSAKVLIWDNNFQAPPALSEIPLTQASLFRIAASTQRPYHGMVIQNPINDHFFAEWNASKIPDHVTVVPLIIQDHVVGMIMGIGKAEAFNRHVLQFTEKLALELNQQLDGKPAQAA